VKVFVISLKRSPERRNHIRQQLESLGINFEFFDAVDGKAETNHGLFRNYNYSKRLWLTSGRMPSAGELGCYASHYLLWQKCVDLHEPILIIEDDAQVDEQLRKLLTVIAQKVNEYGFLRLEEATKSCQLFVKESHSNYSIGFMSENFNGTRSYAIAPQAAEKLLNGSKRWCMPVDNYIGSLYLHGMPSFLLQPSVIRNPGDFNSTIQLGEERRAKWYRKISRELYSLYKKVQMQKCNKQYQ